MPCCPAVQRTRRADGATSDNRQKSGHRQPTVARIGRQGGAGRDRAAVQVPTPIEQRPVIARFGGMDRSEEHTYELQSLMRNSYAVFCLKKKKEKNRGHTLSSSNNIRQNL